MKTRCSAARRTLPLVARRDSFSPLFHLLFIIFFVLAGVYLRAAASPRLDQKPYALIFGTVWGPNDHPIYGVRVKIRLADQKKPKWELVSDHNGEFAQRVPAGKATYIVWVEAKDLKGFKVVGGGTLQPGPEVTVQITNDERQDIGVHLK